MMRASHLLRLFLIFVLCVGGAANAWASARMAVEGFAHAAAAKAGAKAAADPSCDEQDGPRDAAERGGQADPQHDCDCGGQSACACSCALTFFPDNAPIPFAAQHALASVYAGRLKTLTARNEISPVFRPPIG